MMTMSNSDMLKVYDIHQYGDFYKLSYYLNTNKILKTLEDFESKWSHYNPKKEHIPREGLCVFNYSGKCGPGPALDSLKEYNLIHNTNIGESDCNKPTELFWQSKELQEFFEPLVGSVVRTHFLRLKPGGFFPPHRDHTRGVQNSFRIIVPIYNCQPPHSNFILEDKILYMEHGHPYVINTTKLHWLFNADAEDNQIWLVINAKIDDTCMGYIENGLL
jgi:hypothetical protein